MKHLVEVSRLTHYLLNQLGCDEWHLACRHEHQLVIRLSKGSEARYAVCYECRPEVEKAVFHDSQTWGVSLIPLHSEYNLSSEQAAVIKTALTNMPPGDDFGR